MNHDQVMDLVWSMGWSAPLDLEAALPPHIVRVKRHNEYT